MKQAAIRIFEITSDLGITDMELSSRYGFSRSTINNWRNEDVEPGSDMIRKFCESIGISLNDFFTRGVYADKPESRKEKEQLTLNILIKEVLDVDRGDAAIEVMKYLVKSSQYVNC